jgi:predicted nucleotidyltransferase
MNNIMPAENYGLSQQALQQIRQCLAQHAQIEQAVLYGSRAMGTYRPGSDIDLVIVGPKFSHQQLLQLLTALDDTLLPYSFDISRIQDIENEDLLAHITRVGKVLYQRPL